MTFDPFAPGLLSRLPQAPQKIVLLRASHIDDFLYTTPALRALRLALPAAEISMVTLPILQDLARRLPSLDRVFPSPGFPGSTEQGFDAHNTTQFLQTMQAEHFDLAIQLQGTGVYANPFALLLGARTTAGFLCPGDTPAGLDAALPYLPNMHEIERVQAMTTFLGVPGQGDQLDFPLWPQDQASAAGLLNSGERPFIGIQPSARAATSRWFPERFAELANRLQQRHGGTIVLLGDAPELAQTVGQQLEGPYLNLTHNISLLVLGAIIEQLAVLITNDAEPASISYALNTPTVTIFGAGNPATSGPFKPGPFRVLARDVLCRPCGYATCPIGYVCLQGVTVKSAFQAAEKIMR